MGAPVDASVQVGYNLAAEGLDGEAAIARRQGALRLMAAVRLLADPDAGGADVALGTGLVARLTSHVGVSADVVTLTDRGPGERVAWGVGLNLAIPRTPHTFSLHATNVNNATLQSSSRGTGETRYGFEFTIPLTLSRYFGSEPPRPAVSPTPTDTGNARGNVATAAVHDFLFRPARIEVESGTTIVWMNRGQVVHTVTGDEGNFASGSIEPGEQESITFSRPGTYPYHCTPHPFMRGVVVVR